MVFIDTVTIMTYNCALNALSGLVAIRTETKQNLFVPLFSSSQVFYQSL